MAIIEKRFTIKLELKGMAGNPIKSNSQFKRNVLKFLEKAKKGVTHDDIFSYMDIEVEVLEKAVMKNALGYSVPALIKVNYPLDNRLDTVYKKYLKRLKCVSHITVNNENEIDKILVE